MEGPCLTQYKLEVGAVTFLWLEAGPGQARAMGMARLGGVGEAGVEGRAVGRNWEPGQGELRRGKDLDSRMTPSF